MGIFNNQLIINNDNPFEGDKLERKPEAEKLTGLFESVDNQMVLAINSPWGTGKTTFLKMWKADLDLKKYATVFFNCWENDFVEEPFIAFIEEIRNTLGNEIVDRDFIEKSKEMGSILVKQIPTIAKYIVKNKTDVDLNDFISDDDLKTLISEKMDNYKKSKDSIEKFKIELEKKANKNLEKTGKPLIIFVDEIDRCRPDFAIKLLERIKHFFNIPNIIFVLGMDKKALSNSIKVIYGNDTDVEGYLSRFLDLEYRLNEDSKEKIINYLLDKYNIIDEFKKRRIQDCYENNTEELRQILIGCIEITNLSFRDIEKVFVRLLLIIKSNNSTILYIYPMILLLCIKQISSNLYNKIINDKISIEEIEMQLRTLRDNDAIIKNEHTRNIMNAFIAMLSCDEKYINEIKGNEEDKRYRAYEWVNRIISNWDEWQDIKLSYEKVSKIIEMYNGIEL